MRNGEILLRKWLGNEDTRYLYYKEKQKPRPNLDLTNFSNTSFFFTSSTVKPKIITSQHHKRQSNLKVLKEWEYSIATPGTQFLSYHPKSQHYRYLHNYLINKTSTSRTVNNESYLGSIAISNTLWRGPLKYLGALCVCRSNTHSSTKSYCCPACHWTTCNGKSGKNHSFNMFWVIEILVNQRKWTCDETA